MIKVQDCINLLIEIEKSTGINVDNYITSLMKNDEYPIEVMKFINTHRALEVSKFYELLRKNYNAKKSPLYKNILRDDLDVDRIVSTLSSLALQEILYSNKLDKKTDKLKFLTHARFNEITECLTDYGTSLRIDNCKKLLDLIKLDLTTLEMYSGRREEA